jgi:hypothetical protein
LPVLLHLYKPSGAPFTLVDAKNHDNKGYVPDGALVYLRTGQNTAVQWTVVEVVNEQGFVKMTQVRQQGNPGYVKPLEFIYKAKEIVEV